LSGFGIKHEGKRRFRLLFQGLGQHTNYSRNVSPSSRIRTKWTNFPTHSANVFEFCR